MANIGKRIKEITIAPRKEPDPTFVPQEDPHPPVPVEEPEKVSA